MTENESIDNFVVSILHPVPKNQDKNCEHIEWMGEDLCQCPRIGEYKCKINECRTGEYNQNLDYQSCTCDDHIKCIIYLNNKKGKN